MRTCSKVQVEVQRDSKALQGSEGSKFSKAINKNRISDRHTVRPSGQTDVLRNTMQELSSTAPHLLSRCSRRNLDVTSGYYHRKIYFSKNSTKTESLSFSTTQILRGSPLGATINSKQIPIKIVFLDSIKAVTRKCVR
jgi:hypothetical protein